MKNASSTIQKTLDGLIDRLFLWAIPKNITPNAVTIVRFISVPILFFLLASGQLTTAFVLFIFSAATDFIDGAMARTRNQITEVGKVIDPIADKLLVLTVLYYVGYTFWIVRIISVFIILEIITVLLGVVFSRYLGRPMGATAFGKLKMITQCISVFMFFIGFFLNNLLVITISEYLLLFALILAVMAAVEVSYRKLKYLKGLTEIKKLP